MATSYTKGCRKPRLLLWLILLAIPLIGAWIVFGPATDRGKNGDHLFIRSGSNYETVKKELVAQGFLDGTTRFDLMSHALGYPDLVKPGRYKVPAGTSVYRLVRKLRAGMQEPVKLVINKLRTKQDFARLISTQLEASYDSVLRLMNDGTYLSKFSLDTNTAMAAVLPATYEFYWNTSADKAFRKIEAARSAYWTAARKEKARAQGLTQNEAVVMASIVEEETNKQDEKGNIASVYLNRLRQGMKLQADPTAKWAVGDFALKRITSVHTSLAHPYNTYYVTGLPPGPICTPTKGTLNAVLDAPKTDYLYFCAKEDFSGYHRFASNYADHLKNARLYQQALNERNIH